MLADLLLGLAGRLFLYGELQWWSQVRPAAQASRHLQGLGWCGRRVACQKRGLRSVGARGGLSGFWLLPLQIRVSTCSWQTGGDRTFGDFVVQVR